MRRRKTKWCENSESWWRLWPWDDLKTELFPTELTKIDQKKAYWSLMTENGNQNRSWKVSKDHDSGSDSERTRKQNLSKDHDFSSDSERTRRRNLTKDHDSGSDSERTPNPTKDHDRGSDSERTWRWNLSKDHDTGSDSERTTWRRNLSRHFQARQQKIRERKIGNRWRKPKTRSRQNLS